MPMYEFECPRGHVTADLATIGTTEVVCAACVEAAHIEPLKTRLAPMAHRILSPTRTTFEFADHRSKRSIT